jgi:hypothetical protein
MTPTRIIPLPTGLVLTLGVSPPRPQEPPPLEVLLALEQAPPISRSS